MSEVVALGRNKGEDKPDDRLSAVSNREGIELFRLLSVRPPEPATGRVQRLLLYPGELQGDDGQNPLSLASGVMQDLDLSIKEQRISFPLEWIDVELTDRGDYWAPKEIDASVLQKTGHSLHDLVQTDNWARGRQYLHRELIAAVTSPSDGGALADLPVATVLLRACRLVGVLDKIANGDPDLRTKFDVHNYLAYATVQLPETVEISRPSPLARPPAVADLKKVCLGPARYEPTSIAYIENVMATEKRKRMHKVRTEDETITTTTTQRTEENERDLTTSSQVQLQQEASQIIQSSTDLEAGLHVSASYGPTVSVTADARVARHDSTQTANREAASYSNSITQQARQRVVESSMQTRTVRQLLEIEEVNAHGFDNSGNGAKHVVGVYRHVDQVQEAWIENYGKRLMLEFLVPEPAAVLQWALKSGETEDDDPEPTRPTSPTDPTKDLAPGDILVTNYLALVGKYGPSSVTPPPPDSVELAVTFEPQQGADLDLFEDSKTLKVPAGYRATDWIAQCVMWGKGGADHSWMVGVGEDADPKEDNDGAVLKKHLSGKVDAAEGSMIPVIMLGRGWIGMSASVRIHCAQTVDNLNDWKLKVYHQIMSAWTTEHQDWAARDARRRALASVNDNSSPLQGTGDTIENRAVERRELRRCIINLLLGAPQDSGIFQGAAVTRPAGSRPTIDLNVAAKERDSIAFFEQAFEWSNMTWLHYPYYWGASDRWAEDIRMRTTDPQWTAFLTAGATRAVLPVRPGFEWAIGLYLSLGVIWSGGAVPTVGDPAYLGIAEEIAESLGTGKTVAPSVTALDPVRIPTPLVWLQPTADLNLGTEKT